MLGSLAKAFNISLRISKRAAPLINQPLNGFSTSRSINRHPGITCPHTLTKRWAVDKIINPNEYTVDPLPLVRTAGRGPDGHILYKHRTTGLRRPWFMVDYNFSRHLPSGQVHKELVLKIVKNWWRTPMLALVASGDVKRWIVATSTLKPGDIVRSHVEIPVIPVTPTIGDAYPVGALPVGTTICLVELRSGQGAIRCRAAGCSATVIRRGKFVGDEEARTLHQDDELTDERAVIIRDNGTRKLLRLRPECMVVVGQVSNVDHNKQKFSKFGEKYWRGVKQRSGLWQRKTGRFGRKIHPIGPVVDYMKESPSSSQFTIKCTLPKFADDNRQKTIALHAMKNLRPKDRHQPTPSPYNGLPDSQPRFRWCTWETVR